MPQIPQNYRFINIRYFTHELRCRSTVKKGQEFLNEGVSLNGEAKVSHAKQIACAGVKTWHTDVISIIITLNDLNKSHMYNTHV